VISSEPTPTPPAPHFLTAPADARIVGLIGPASNGRLLVYAGAGLSLDSGLPTGAALSQEIHTRLTHMGVSLPEVDSGDLLAVADAAEAEPGGLAAVQSVACCAFPFTTVSPSASHRALALLLLEGVAAHDHQLGHLHRARCRSREDQHGRHGC